MTPRPEVPIRPPEPMHRTDADVVSQQAPLWRIHRTRCEQVVPWNDFRRFGR